ncbi:HpcH/HpaI aldolase/citrate lyase family protein [Pseudomonas sp. LRF_L74]|uniref:HpcH/HpaI aldolase/citrate lyase family protein n=1 Tax=Pseudomonas sp. LRF_L74 TaxID=3369422 RepID=UPI003F610A97
MLDSQLRSALFVPGNRPERFAKALASGADAVIVDFEDAVEESHKAQAREHLRAFLDENAEARVWVRVNMAAHAQHLADLDLCRHSGVLGVLLPKAESAGQVTQALARTGKPLLPIIESTLGIEALAQIARVHGVQRLTYGGLDLSLDLGLTAGTPAAERLLDQVRFALLQHSRLAGLAAPLETVFPAIGDPAGLARFARDAADMGFSGMLCIHPKQVTAVHQALAPSEQELDWARRVLASDDSGGAYQLDGQMIDAPVLARARRLLARTR